MRNHIINAITVLAEIDQRIMIVTGDLGYSVLEEFATKFPDRYINCGIAEQNMTAVAAGLALEGNTVFTYSIGNFATLRCLEQIRNDVCYHHANVKIIAVGGGFSYGTLGMTHHATEDIAVMRALPNMRVYAPADHLEATAVLRAVCETREPCYIRLARGSDAVLHNMDKIDRVDNLINVMPGEDIVILTTGTILEEGIITAKLLQESGINASLYSCPAIKPMDIFSIRQLSNNAKLMITLEEHNLSGGFGSAIAEILVDMPKHASLKRFGLHDTYTEVIGSQKYLRKAYGLDGKSIADEVFKIWKTIVE